MSAGRDHSAAARVCPHSPPRDDRKSAALGGQPGEARFERVGQNDVRIRGIDLARQILRSDGLRQAGFMADLATRLTKSSHAPVLFQEGETHRKLRSATARFFAPKVVSSRYRALMTAESARLMNQLRVAGRAKLDALGLELSVAVSADIVGLTNSVRPGLADRLKSFFDDKQPVEGGKIAAAYGLVRSAYRMLKFYWYDVRPAIKERRRERREDIISHLIDQGYNSREILTECITYGAAGVATTRELIAMAAWHLFERSDLRMRFLNSDETGQVALIEEVLRLEPVVGVLYRRAERDLVLDDRGQTEHVSTGTLLAIDVRAVNADISAAGACPHALDPDRRIKASKWPASLMSFGDGPHRCPGATVALLESAIFLDHLFRLPGIRLMQKPRMTANPLVESYELRDVVVTCERSNRS